MAASRYSNVIVMVDTDTITGPVIIESATLVGGSGTSTASLANGASLKFLDLGSVAASTAVQLRDLDIRVASGDTVTATLTGTGAKLYLNIR